MSGTVKQKSQQENTTRRILIIFIFVAIVVYLLMRISNSADNQQTTNMNASVGKEDGSSPTNETSIENNEENNSNVSEKEATNAPTEGIKVYKNDAFGWQIETTTEQPKETKEGDITTIEFSEGKVSIMPQEQEGMVTSSLSNTREAEIILTGYKGKKLEGDSLKDGSSTMMILLKKDEELYVFTGSEIFLNRNVLESFTFLK